MRARGGWLLVNYVSPQLIIISCFLLRTYRLLAWPTRNVVYFRTMASGTELLNGHCLVWWHTADQPCDESLDCHADFTEHSIPLYINGMLITVCLSELVDPRHDLQATILRKFPTLSHTPSVRKCFSILVVQLEFSLYFSTCISVLYAPTNPSSLAWSS